MEMQILKCHQTAKRLPVQSTWQPSRKATLRRLLAFACLLVLASAASAQLRERTVASLDSARCVSGELQNKQFLVTDGISATDCLVGGGAIPAACVCDSGVFRALASGYVLLAGDEDGQAIYGMVGGYANLSISSDEVGMYGGDGATGYGVVTANTTGVYIEGVRLTIISAQTPPTNANDACTAGDTIYTATFHYYCHATNTWVRVAMATW